MNRLHPIDTWITGFQIGLNFTFHFSFFAKSCNTKKHYSGLCVWGKIKASKESGLQLSECNGNKVTEMRQGRCMLIKMYRDQPAWPMGSTPRAYNGLCLCGGHLLGDTVSVSLPSEERHHVTYAKLTNKYMLGVPYRTWRLFTNNFTTIAHL